MPISSSISILPSILPTKRRNERKATEEINRIKRKMKKIRNIFLITFTRQYFVFRIFFIVFIVAIFFPFFICAIYLTYSKRKQMKTQAKRRRRWSRIKEDKNELERISFLLTISLNYFSVSTYNLSALHARKKRKFEVM